MSCNGMRRFLILFLSATALLGLTVSCYKDYSTEADHEIPDIVITGVDSVMHVVYGDEIRIEAQVSQEGRTLDDFLLEWSIDLSANRLSDRIEMGEGLVFSYKVAHRPSDIPYVIRLDVTDKLTGLVKVAACRLYVSSAMGEGLLVAYTRDGGKTSEFDLLANRYVTYGYDSDEPRYTRELYALANQKTFDEKVNAVLHIVDSDNASYNEQRIMVGTENHLHAFDPLTFMETASDGGLFNSSNVSSFGTTALFNFSGYQTAAVVDGSMYVIPTLLDRSYSVVAYRQTPSNIFTATNCAASAMNGSGMAVFDPNKARFYGVVGYNAHQAAFAEIVASFSFPLSGAQSLGAGETRGQQIGFLLRDASGGYHVCIIDMSLTTPVVRDFALSGNGLDELVSVAFCDNCDLMYYATPRNLYAVITAAGRVSVRQVNWTPDSPDEKITSIRQYRQAWYGAHNYFQQDYAFILDTHRLQMVITTYNETTGEGKIYLRPFNVSTGLFTSKSNGVYGGFGEILAIAPTFS